MFPIFTKKFSKKKIRRLADISILFDRQKTFKENFETASTWKQRILNQADVAVRNTFQQSGREPNSNGEGEERIGRTYMYMLKKLC